MEATRRDQAVPGNAYLHPPQKREDDISGGHRVVLFPLRRRTRRRSLFGRMRSEPSPDRLEHREAND